MLGFLFRNATTILVIGAIAFFMCKLVTQNKEISTLKGDVTSLVQMITRLPRRRISQKAIAVAVPRNDVEKKNEKEEELTLRPYHNTAAPVNERETLGMPEMANESNAALSQWFDQGGSSVHLR